MPFMPSVAEWRERFKLSLIANSSGRLSLATIEQEGSDLWALVESAAQVAHQVAYENAKGYLNLMLDSASGDELDRLVLDRFGITRNPAAPSRGTLAVWASPALVTALTISAETVARSTEGVRYQNIADVTIPAGSTAKVTVSGQSTLAGAGLNAAQGTITAWESPPGSGVFVSNATADGGTAFAGSADAETDEALRERARGYWEAAQRATREALILGALEVDGVTQASVFETLQSDGTYGGIAELFVSDERGESSAALVADVVAELEEWRAAGIFVDVTGGTPQYVDVEIDVSLISGYNLSTVKADIIDACVAYGLTLAPGETLVKDDLAAAIRAVPGVVRTLTNVVDPAGNVVPATNDIVLRISAGGVSFS